MNISPTPFHQTDLQAFSNVAHYSINVLLKYYKAHILYITIRSYPIIFDISYMSITCKIERKINCQLQLVVQMNKALVITTLNGLDNCNHHLKWTIGR